MNARALVHRLEYGAYQAVAGVTQRLPLARAARLGTRGRLARVHLLGRRRRLALDNLARALPELDAAARGRVARECFEVQSATYHEQIWAMRRGTEIAERFEFVGREHFEAARARGKGVFVLTGHYGCWELAGYPLGRWLGKLYIVARPQNNPYIAAHFEGLRESNGNEQIDREPRRHAHAQGAQEGRRDRRRHRSDGCARRTRCWCRSSAARPGPAACPRTSRR